MDQAIAVLVGLVMGLHSATWGMYKDSPHEGFTRRQYFRSVWIGAVAAPLLAFAAHIDVRTAGGLVVLFGATYGVERAILEFWKTFLRVEDQSKYFIPMQFAVMGRVVGRRTQLLVGLGCVIGALGLAAGLVSLNHRHADWRPALLAFLVGSAVGWVSAFGGAWKDAPLEGFETLKFFRSPLLAGAYGMMVGSFTTDFLLILLGALGYTVATIETYKTFFFPHRPRGKFAGKAVRFPRLLRVRNRFVPLYVLIWFVVIATIVAAYLRPRSGLA